ncbi:MAG: imidazole glycerol phosphate synthase subunit HisH [Selenomonadaceae bacterium]|nr:imidazole glycerol phosphate synthase subunit HisH [Selenomonadaceae bacterium]
MIVLIDYGVGNLYSVAKATAYVGGDVKISSAAEDIKRAEKIILPGVGAFGDCMKNLEATGLIPTIKQEISAGKPILGICVGMQILFAGSEESPNVDGLKIFGGNVRKICADNLKIPHMGWNAVAIRNSQCVMRNLFKDIKDNSYFYFVHSYHAVPDDKNIIAATTTYGEEVTAAVEFENIFATQFHPEKSGDVGLQVLKNFLDA